MSFATTRVDSRPSAPRCGAGRGGSKAARAAACGFAARTAPCCSGQCRSERSIRCSERGACPGRSRPRVCSLVLEQALDVIEFELRSERLAKPAAQFFENAARPLHIDLARHLDADVAVEIAAAQRAAQRIGFRIRPRLRTAGLTGSGAHAELLLHRLRQALRALAQRFERAAL